MDYTTAGTIAYRLSKMNPWAFVESTRRDNVPQHECNFCAWRKYINMHGMYSTHDPACLWVAAVRYADELDNAPVASQEPAENPIESRVDELLSEGVTDEPAPLWKAPFCERQWGDDGHKHCVANMCGCECHA